MKQPPGDLTEHIFRLQTDSKESSGLAEKIQRLGMAIFQQRPQLLEVLRRDGSRPILAYLQKSRQYALPDFYRSRGAELAGVLSSEAARILGPAVAADPQSFGNAINYLPTADHLGPLAHPFFAASNVLNALTASADQPAGAKPLCLPVLASSSVSLNNSSYPRGILFHAKDGGGRVNEFRLPLQPKRKRMSAVFALQPYRHEEVEQAKAMAKKAAARKELRQAAYERVSDLLSEIYQAPAALALSGYSEQITWTNFHLWQRLFPPRRPPSPQLLYLDFERVAAELLVRNHLHGNTEIAQLLFDPASRRAGLDILDNVVGGYSSKTGEGTIFFWAFENDRRVPLTLRDGNLESSSPQISIALQPDAIAQALTERRLMPNLLLGFLLYAGYYGCNCWGGFSQVDYLTVMLDKWRQFLRTTGNDAEAKNNEAVPTTVLYGDLVLPQVSSPTEPDRVTPASFIDLVLYQTPRMVEELTQAAGRLTLAQSIAVNLPEFYNILYTPQEQQADLTAINDQDIIRALEQKNTFYRISL